MSGELAASSDLQLRARAAELRCPYCHDELAAASARERVSCPACGTEHHLACAQELRRCATLACERALEVGLAFDPGAGEELRAEVRERARCFAWREADPALIERRCREALAEVGALRAARQHEAAVRAWLRALRLRERLGGASERLDVDHDFACALRPAESPLDEVWLDAHRPRLRDYARPLAWAFGGVLVACGLTTLGLGPSLAAAPRPLPPGPLAITCAMLGGVLELLGFALAYRDWPRCARL
ncbi:MAG: RING finger protein [Planctomycetota bacterium]